MEALLTCRDLVKRYGAKTALHGLSLTVEPGRIVGLLGPNGSGKTTLIKLASGLLTPTSGEITIAGHAPGVETKSLVSYLPERSYLSDWMRVEDTLRFFCDFYAESVFPVWSSISTRVMSVFPFSVGEGMIVLGILFLTAFAAVGFLRLTVKKAWSKKLFHSFSCTFSWIFLALVWVMTCNCFLLYHSSAFEDRYMEQVRSENYSKAELAVLRDYIVVNANELAEQMERDADGYLIYKGDMNQAAVEAMQQVGTDYGRLQGYYPQPKEIYFSELLSQTYRMGYYFPFSMEANYNGTMYIVNKPSVICHEFAHLKGFMQEDEANLIGYLACINSDDAFFRYSGYMGVLNYVEKEFRTSIQKSRKEYAKHPQISAQVYADNMFLTQEAWQTVEKKAFVSTKTAKKVSNAATTASLKLNGVEEGMKAYDGVVKLLLDYYDGVLYGDVLVTVDAE